MHPNLKGSGGADPRPIHLLQALYLPTTAHGIVLRRDKDSIFFNKSRMLQGLSSVLALPMTLIQTSLETYILGVDIKVVE